MNMCPSQVSPPRTPDSNEYVPLAGVLLRTRSGLWWWWRYDDDERLVAIVVTMVLVEGGDGSSGDEDGVEVMSGAARLLEGEGARGACGMVDRIDRVMRNIFGFGRKTCRKSFTVAAAVVGGRNPAAAEGARRKN
ncbi:hypothetical protein Tco_0997285 [Tanacetum coccineum]